MRLICVAVIIFLQSFSFAAISQNYVPQYQAFTPVKQSQVINLVPIEVSYDMTTHIIFPNEIIYVDLGSNSIVSEKAEKVGNILKVKANRRDFASTNMTVVTSDGKYFSFMCLYAAFPKTLNIKLSSADFSTVSRKVQLGTYDNAAAYALFDEVKMNEGEMNKYSYEILKKGRSLHHLGEEKYNMQVNLRNLFVRDNVLFFDFYFRNKSTVNYDIDFFKFYIADAETLKRTAQQELEVTPLYTLDPDGSNNITGKSKTGKVFCFQRFTIPDKKVFMVELFEKNGGRKFSFQITNKDIIEAKTF